MALKTESIGSLSLFWQKFGTRKVPMNAGITYRLQYFYSFFIITNIFTLPGKVSIDNL